MSEARQAQEDEAGFDGLAELLFECGFSEARAERVVRVLARLSEPEFGEDEN
jgi:hypothetical protein